MKKATPREALNLYGVNYGVHFADGAAYRVLAPSLADALRVVATYLGGLEAKDSQYVIEVTVKIDTRSNSIAWHPRVADVQP